MSSLAKSDQIRLIFEDQIDRKELTLPLLPEVASSVIQLSTSDDVDARQLADLISKDMSLTGHIMRVANSALYRPVTPFVSLQQAIARLGIVTISEIALATSLNSDLFVAPGYKALLNRFWLESIHCSAWAKEIARIRRTNVESSFLAGLLCQMGKPVVVQALADFALEEKQLLEFVDDYYVRSGALLASLWHLPTSVGEVIIHHRHPQPENEHRDITLNVQAALQLSCDGGGELSDAMLTQLNFYPDDLEKLKHSNVQSWVDAVGG